MSGFDIVFVVLVIAYAALGAYNGVIRRVIGIVGLYVAFFAATYVGQAAVPQFQSVQPSVDLPDVHIYLFFGTLLVIVLVVEGVASLYHEHLQLSTVALNRATGALLGIVTAVVLTAMLWTLGNDAGNPTGGASTSLQVGLRTHARNSSLARPLALSFGPTLLVAFGPVLPHDPTAYFGSATQS